MLAGAVAVGTCRADLAHDPRTEVPVRKDDAGALALATRRHLHSLAAPTALARLAGAVARQGHDNLFPHIRLLERDLVLHDRVFATARLWRSAGRVEACSAAHAHAAEHGLEHVVKVGGTAAVAAAPWCAVRSVLVVCCALETSERGVQQDGAFTLTSFGSMSVSYAWPIAWNISCAFGSSGFLS